MYLKNSLARRWQRRKWFTGDHTEDQEHLHDGQGKEKGTQLQWENKRCDHVFQERSGLGDARGHGTTTAAGKESCNPESGGGGGWYHQEQQWKQRLEQVSAFSKEAPALFREGTEQAHEHRGFLCKGWEGILEVNGLRFQAGLSGVLLIWAPGLQTWLWEHYGCDSVMPAQKEKARRSDMPVL